MPQSPILLRAFLALSLLPLVAAGGPPVQSGVYSWSPPAAVAGWPADAVTVVSGNTTDLERFTVEGVVLPVGGSRKEQAPGAELLVVVRSGVLEAVLGGEGAQLGPGGSAYVLDADVLELTCSGPSAAAYVVIRFDARGGADGERAKASAGSLLMPFGKVPFAPSERGGYRQQCRRPTPLFREIEMHTTTLNPDLFNHDVHTHRAEELVVMLTGSVEMQIDGRTIEATPGDIMFLGADVPHGLLHNVGAVPTEYIAFQWQR